MQTSTWNEADHPRAPVGRTNGGQFISFTHASPTEMKLRGTEKDKHYNDLKYNKEKKRWETADGDPVPDHIAARLKEIGAKPGHVRVALNPDYNAPLQYRGIDAKGRVQPIYSAAHSEASAAEKFARLKEFNSELPALSSKIAAGMKAGDDSAAVLRVIERTGIRVGSDRETFAAQRAYGASTLLGQHVKIDGDMVSLNFPGKSGKVNERMFKDPELAAYLSGKKLSENTRVFDTRDTKVRDTMDKMTRSKGFSPKDFRTMWGTATAISAIKSAPKPKNEKEWNKLHADVSKTVSSFLGNTPAVASKYYIDPAVWPDKKGF